MTFADTNWLVAMFFELDGELKQRNQIVDRFLRNHSGQLLVSPVVMLEAENVFRQEAEDHSPAELVELDNDRRFYRDPMNWACLKRDTSELFRKYSHKHKLGTFDVTLLASAKLAGAKTILSFDEDFKALAAAEGLKVFPELTAKGLATLAALK